MNPMRSSDLTRGMTLRNAGEHRRLEGHIKTLDAQLRQNLVSLQAEIMEVKSSPYAGRRSRGRSPARQGNFAPGKLHPRAPEQQREATNCAVNGNQRFQKNALPQIQVSSKESVSCSNRSFLPQINTADSWLVSQRSPETLSPVTRRRARSPDPAITRHLLATPHVSNLYKPRSSPNIASASTQDYPSSGLLQRSRRKQGRPFEQGDQAQERPEILQTRVKPTGKEEYFKKQPSGSSLEDVAKGNVQESAAFSEVESQEACKQESHSGSQKEDSAGDGAKGEEEELERHLLYDEALFRNSLLLKASRDDGLSSSLPDLKSLGFMDFNEVIDQRLRQVQDEIPSKEEMRKIRYLRFPDEPLPPNILSVFEKENPTPVDKDEQLA